MIRVIKVIRVIRVIRKVVCIRVCNNFVLRCVNFSKECVVLFGLLGKLGN